MIEQQTLLDDRYRILEPLGSGGMSEVYLCRDELLDREVALKVLREQYASDEEFVERFGREARSAASLQHPNIASVYDRGRSQDGRYYIAMEYVPGGTLAEHLGCKGPLPAPTAAAVAGQVASALGAAHAEGVIHRDVKPQNVLITREGDVKLADFGIARAAANTSVSQTGHVLGTARYMSPEQAMGEHTTPRSDLYSLGGVLYEMLTGEAPFEADTPVAVSLKHVGERPHHPAEINPEVPEGMDAVVMRLLAKHPAERYESAEDLAEDLGRLQDGLPPVRAVANATMPVSAVGIPFGGEATDAAPVSVGGAGAGPDDADEALPDSTHGKQRSRRRKLLLFVAPLAIVALFAAVLLDISRTPGDGDVIGSLDDAPGNALGEVRGAVQEAEQALLGPQEATIPEVESLSEEQARERLEERGFGAESRSRQSSEGDAGTVLEQSVPGGEQAEEGSVVLIAVGEGPVSASSSSGSGDRGSSDTSATSLSGENGAGSGVDGQHSAAAPAAKPIQSSAWEPSREPVQARPAAQGAPTPPTKSTPEQSETVSDNQGGAGRQLPAPAPQLAPETSPAQPSDELSSGTGQASETPATDTEFPDDVPVRDSDGSSAGDLPPDVAGTGPAGNVADQYTPAAGFSEAGALDGE